MTNFKSTEWTMAKAEEVFNKVQERAKTDVAFRNLCITDVNTAVKEVSGLDIPEGFEVNLVEGANGELLFAPKSRDGEQELDESELEMVSGGVSFSSFIIYGPGDRGHWDIEANCC